MGLLDNIGKFGTALEDAFTPAEERLVNQLRRQQLLDNQRREKALGLLGTSLFPDIPSTVTPGSGQNRTGLDLSSTANSFVNARTSPGVDRSRERDLFGLISTLNPEAAAAAGLSTIFPPQKTGRPSLTEKVAEVETILGRPLSEPELNQFVGLGDGGQDKALERIKTRNEILQQQLGFEDRIVAKEEKVIAKQKRDSEMVDSIATGIENIGTAFDANSELFNTFGETGLLGQSGRDFLIKGGVELGVEGARDLQIARDNFKKGTSNVLLDTFQTLNDLGVITDTKFRRVETSLAGLGTNPVTNAKILKQQTMELKRLLERESLGQDQIAAIDRLIRKIEVFEELNKRSGK